MLARIVMQSRQMSSKIATKSGAAQGIAIGSGVIGLGGLAYSLKHAIAPADNAMIHNVGIWPKYVKDRLFGTFGYCLSGLGATALGGMAALRSPTAMRLFGGGSAMSFLGCMVLMMGSGFACQAVPFDGSALGMKAALYYLHMGIVGGVISPILTLGGSPLVRAGAATLGIFASLAVTGMVAPSDAYINTYGYVNAGCFLMLGACAVSFFAPPMGALSLGLESLIMYGGLALFTVKGFQDLQKAAALAQQPGQYDPINNALHITMDAINVFIRLALMFANGKKK